MNIKTTLKLSVTAAALFAIATPVSSPANAADDTLKSGNKNSLTISGYVAKSLWYADDGVDSQLFITDGSTSRTRVRWIAKGTVNENVTAGAFIEMDIPLSNQQTNATLGGAGAATFGQGEANANATSWAIRHQFVWVDHKKFGKVSLGNTDAAANGNMEAMLSGTTAIDLSSAIPFCTSCLFVNDTTATAKTRGASVTSAISNFDFTSRDNVLRYDTPRFMGLRVSVSLNDQGGGEIGGRYSGKFGAFAVDARAGYSELSSSATGATAGSGDADYVLGGSIAVLHDSGLNVSFAGGKRPLESTATLATARTPHFWAVSGGYKAKIFKIGGTNFNVLYNRTAQASLKGAVGESLGVTVLQEFDPIGANIGVFYKNYSYEAKRTTAGVGRESFDSIDVIGLQTIFNF